jgi:hypothetical protein
VPVVIRYTAWAHGPRDEILSELERASGGQRSERKQAALAAAIEELRSGASVVKVGPTRYVVTGEAERATSEFISVVDGDTD